MVELIFHNESNIQITEGKKRKGKQTNIVDYSAGTTPVQGPEELFPDG